MIYLLINKEMPTCCRECPLYIGGMYGKGITKSFVTMCGANHSENFEDVTRYRLHSCPLKEAPEPKSEWQKDHEILKAYSDGANGVLEEIRAEIAEEKEHAYADFERYKVEYLGQDGEDALDSLPQDDFRYGMERCIDIIDKYKTESEDKECYIFS